MSSELIPTSEYRNCQMNGPQCPHARRSIHALHTFVWSWEHL